MKERVKDTGWMGMRGRKEDKKISRVARRARMEEKKNGQSRRRKGNKE